MDTGGKIRTGNILKHLSKKNDITLISNVESPKDDPYLTEIKNLCNKFVPVKWKEIKKHSIFFYIRLFFQMFSIYPVSALNDYSKSLRSELEREIRKGKYDLAICDFVQSALMFTNFGNIPTILFQHNVESMIPKRHYKEASNAISLIFWWLQWKKMLWYEKKMCRVFNTVIAVSENDKEAFQKLYNLINVTTIPTGVDIEYFKPNPVGNIDDNSLVFCGSMDWLPNEDAVIFFINDILPILKNSIKDIKITVVGRNPSPNIVSIVKDYQEVELTGWVEDIRPYIAKSAVYIVPIRIGGGTRMKIFEAMAMGKLVVSTSIGAEGLPVTNGENIILENDALTFGHIISYYLNDDEKRKEIGKTGYEFVRDNFSWSRVAKKFENICQVTFKSFDSKTDH